MKPEDTAWLKLVALSKGAHDDRSASAPYGFATRVVATAFATESRASTSLFERWSLRAVAVAGLFAALAVAFDYSATKQTLVDDMIADEATVATLFD